MKILFLSRWFPYPVTNGSRLRIFNLLRILGATHDVTLLSFTEDPQASLEAPEIRAICSDVQVVRWKEFDPNRMGARLGFLSIRPRSIVDTFSSEMAQRITTVLGREKYDLVIASQLPMAAYHGYFKGIPALFEEVELGLAYEDSGLIKGWKTKLRHRLAWLKLRSYLHRLLRDFRGVTVVSESEREIASQSLPAIKNILLVPNCINLPDYSVIDKDPDPRRLIFTGSFRYSANYEAMNWFVDRVFPLILRQRPEVELVITGDHANLPLPSNVNVTLAGQVKDIQELIASSAIAIAPLQSGGGTRLKILEAMALGVPVVATSKGAEGLDVRHGEHLLIADEPEVYANCIITLLQDLDYRRRLAEQARILIEKKYEWCRIAPEFLRFVESLCDAQ